MNKVRLIGNVGKELTTRTFANGKLATFTVATLERFTDKNNVEQTQTHWHNIVAFGKVADACENLVKKGKLISIEGKISPRSYQAQNGTTRYITEIMALNVTELNRA